MYNPGDDNELDRLSRDAASGFEAPGSPDWQTMLVQLDKTMPQEKKRRFLFFWWLVPVLLSGSIAFWYFSHQPAENTTAVKQVNGATAVPAASPAGIPNNTVQSAIKNSNPAETTASFPVTAEKNILNTIPDRSSVTYIAKQNIAQTKTTSPVKQNAPAVSDGTNQTSVAETTPVQEAVAPPVTSIVKPTQDVSTTSDVLNPNKTNTDTQTEPAVTAEKKETVAAKDSAGTTTVVTVKKKNKTAWSIGALAGVDRSTVKFTYGDDPGYNVGIIGGYHFSDKLSVHTGAIYTQKNYKMAGADFTAPKGSWVSYYKLETVQGYCRMWEVPLQLQYNFSNSGNHSFYVSTGLSSYFMTEEDYNYAYHYNGQAVLRNNSYESTDKHILSIADLSIGYEKRIGNKLFLQVEPYAKIPLGGVGFGSIRLSSYGLNISVQYRQPAKK